MANPYPFINTDAVHKAFLEAETDNPAGDADNWMREQVALLLAEIDPQLHTAVMNLAAAHFPDRSLGLAIQQMLWGLVENDAA